MKKHQAVLSGQKFINSRNKNIYGPPTFLDFSFSLIEHASFCHGDTLNGKLVIHMLQYRESQHNLFHNTRIKGNQSTNLVSQLAPVSPTHNFAERISYTYLFSYFDTWTPSIMHEFNQCFSYYTQSTIHIINIHRSAMRCTQFVFVVVKLAQNLPLILSRDKTVQCC